MRREGEVTFGLGSTPIGDLVAVAHGAPLRVASEALAAVERTHLLLAGLAASGQQIYGLTTGVGDLYKVEGVQPDVSEVQLGMLRSHASGVGTPHDEPATRAIVAAIVRSLSRGHSGIRPALVSALVDLLNHGVTPVAPSQGSVGYLTATAHIGLAVFGEGEAWFGGERLPAAEALARAGLVPLVPAAREGHAIISGTYEITGIGALAVAGARALVDVADLAGAMSLEALRGNTRGYDPRLQALRPHPGQIETARRLNALLADSEILAANRDHRLQDALSLRCIPQVHGSVRDALGYVESAVQTEIDAVTDNPVFLIEDDELVALPGGNGHGAPVALALDTLAIAVAEVSTMSQARADRLTHAALSGLPAFLASGAPGMSGFMIPPYVAAALAGENRALAAPASVHTVATCAGQEDHVSMGTTAAIQARQAVVNAERIVAIELLCAAEALDFHAPLGAGAGTSRAHALIRAHVAPRDTDRLMAPDIDAVTTLVTDGTLGRIVAETTSVPEGAPRAR